MAVLVAVEDAAVVGVVGVVMVWSGGVAAERLELARILVGFVRASAPTTERKDRPPLSGGAVVVGALLETGVGVVVQSSVWWLLRGVLL